MSEVPILFAPRNKLTLGIEKQAFLCTRSFVYFPFVEALLSFIGRENRFRASDSAANREDKASVQSEVTDGIPNF